MQNFHEIWLSVDLSSPVGSLAIHEKPKQGNPRILNSKTITTNGDHSERFVPVLQESLIETGISPKSFSKLVTSSGPGSFTGLRIAFASVKALAYDSEIPIEILSGSEARALHWAKSQNYNSYKKIHVVTYITRERFVSAEFEIDSDGKLTLMSESTFTDWSFLEPKPNIAVLFDSRAHPIHAPQLKQNSVFSIDLRADLLGDALLIAQTRKTYTTIQDWIELSPNYFGSTRY
ncbi:MAG: tRNA (adenosine(37)-N6)-threonylcarbamoyltransferase complex dimerization subunit type 1 TsaB [Proteobacteria bacterium]|nr:tRNA (adenosine(37)-N6)-threonylcarbamoyltransferase complex dimerization subunit type 1 TsaB [Pseudomonadota bacterium]